MSWPEAFALSVLTICIMIVVLAWLGSRGAR